MADPKDRSTREAPAAEADLLGGEATNKGVVPGPDVSPAGGARREDTADRGQAAPGEDENQAGFLKDPDKRFQP